MKVAVDIKKLLELLDIAISRGEEKGLDDKDYKKWHQELKDMLEKNANA